jgi:hypothetical protein
VEQLTSHNPTTSPRLWLGGNEQTRPQDSRVLRLFMNKSSNNEVWVVLGAGDETRTRDIDLGRVALYQLSYSRSEARFGRQLFFFLGQTRQLADPDSSAVVQTRASQQRQPHALAHRLK